jgi:ketosteroid isomerase-like protein
MLTRNTIEQSDPNSWRRDTGGDGTAGLVKEPMTRCLYVRVGPGLPMDQQTADDLIDTYFDSLDSTDYETLFTILADDFELVTGVGDVYQGIEDIKDYYRNTRGDRDSDHQTHRRRYGDDFAVAEGEATLNDGDGTVESEFCDVFDFQDGKLARVAIYSRRD